MSDPEMPIAAPETAVEPSNEPEATEVPLEQENGSKAAHEAKKYRLRLRDAESALAAANARVEAYQTREVERIAAEKLSVPADLFALSGKSVADFLDEHGEIDSDAVKSTAAELTESRPGLTKPKRFSDPSQGLGEHNPPAAPQWKDLFH